MPRDDQYALIIKQGSTTSRRYPTDSLSSTVDSINNFARESVSMPEEDIATAGYFLKQAAMLYGITDVEPLNAFETKPSTNIVIRSEKKASQGRRDYKTYALGNRYPLDNVSLVKQASDFFDENWRSFDQSNRRIYATNVQKQADKLNVPVSERIHKYASDSFNPRLDYELAKRARLAGEEGADAFYKLASFIGKSSVDEFIVVLSRLDEKYGIDKYYPVVEDPSTVVLEKSASGPYGSMWEIDGVTYTQQDMLKALSHPDIIMMYGANLVSQLRDPHAFDELPMNDKKVILQYAQS